MTIHRRLKQAESRLQVQRPCRILSREEVEAALRKITPEELAEISDDAVFGSITGRHYKAILATTIDFINWRDRHYEQSPA